MTSIAMGAGTGPARSWKRIGESLAPSPSSPVPATATAARGTHSTTVPAAAIRLAVRAPRADRAEDTRWNTSIATRLPRPSANMVAQLITEPAAGSVSCARSSTPRPSGAEYPGPRNSQSDSPTKPTVMTPMRNSPVYTDANIPPTTVPARIAPVTTRIASP